MKIVVLGGGDSVEREVSLRSAKNVAQGLRDAGHDVVEVDTVNGLDILDNIDPKSIVFPILHGAGGEDGSIQSELEARHFKYLGSGIEANKNSFDKSKTKQILAKGGLPLAKGEVVTQDSYWTSHLQKHPHVLKVCRGGSSLGTYIVKDSKNIDKEQVTKVFALDDSAILEELVEGIEITIPILGNKALPVIEIVPPNNEEFNYENKYNGKTQDICPAVSISSEQQAKAQRLAEKVHELLGCRHWSRVDMIVRPNGDIIVLEINTIPGMNVQSLYPVSAREAGYSLPQLMNEFIRLVNGQNI